ncbi:HNH endonuclease [Natranaeroarchaeum sulfidigenes]|uniref:DNA-binding transcriptional regulator, HxlR family n=1 Tax=Natranaeroarchaeum sulfidigenes TaxID=2784880 RepID=A0A897MV27_9EURY|nr:HNH endonuclease [Natranaeroarchaeum sulfidigenes]QSG02799.1 DNA-binding transcriptional regulator, HxlR family [Natranaeroarchaeum sulfidigenes]
MQATNSQSDDDESTSNTTAGEGESDTEASAMAKPHDAYETVDPETRKEVLEEHNHRCQSCGRRGPGNDGVARLQVHHIDRDPDRMDEHALENLSLYCVPCHRWLHQRSTPDEAPVTLTESESQNLLSKDIEILRYLAAHGPARTGDIAAGLRVDASVSTVRQRLWKLMGLDKTSEDRDEQLVDKNIETGEWGFPEQIEHSARGHIPDNTQLLLQRVEDEQVRDALERGCKRQHVQEVFGITRRTTFNKVKRAQAFDFPLDVVSNQSGRPSKGTVTKHESNASESESDHQQRLGDVDNRDRDDRGPTEPMGASEATTATQSVAGDDHRSEDVSTESHQHLQDAIKALQAVDEELSL